MQILPFCALKRAFHAQIIRLKAIRVIIFFGGDRHEIENFFLRYGEQGACCASWRGSYEPPVPEALKNAIMKEEKKKAHGDK